MLLSHNRLEPMEKLREEILQAEETRSDLFGVLRVRRESPVRVDGPVRDQANHLT